MNKKALIIGVLVLILFAGGLFWLRQKKNKSAQEKGIKTLQEQSKEEKQETLEDLVNEVEEVRLPATDMTNWQSYKNDEYGFEMKIPKDWHVANINDGVFCLKNRTKLFYFEGEKDVCGISLDAKYSNRYFKNTTEFVNLVRKLQDQGVISKIGHISSGSKNNLYFQWSNVEVVAIINNDNIWNVTVSGADSSIGPVFYGIIQTLNFPE